MPALIFMVAMIGFPILYNFYISFFDMTAQSVGMGHAEFIGLKNYEAIFSDPTMWKAIKNYIFYYDFLYLYFSL